MIRLQANHVYQHGHETAECRRLRLVHVDERGAYFTDVSGPSKAAFFESNEDLRQFTLSLSSDPWLSLRSIPDDLLTKYQIESRDYAYAAVKLATVAASEKAQTTGAPWILLLLERNSRIQITKQVAPAAGIAASSISRWIYRWLQRGMCLNACLPDTDKMSGKGTVRAIPSTACDSAGNPLEPARWKKPGRKPVGRNYRPAPVGIRMSEPILKSIQTRGVKLYLENKTFTYGDAFCLWKSEYLSHHSVDRMPTYVAFWRILRQNDDIVIAAQGRQHFGRRQRQKPPIQESTSTRVPGPGFRYQIDSTPPPLRLKYSHADTTTYAVVVYFVTDTASKAITGYYISTKPACAETAIKAFAHSTEDKVIYCAKYGITISRSHWPMATVPNELVADRGELVGPIADILVSHYMIRLDNTPAYSPQLKADVEAAFGSAMRRMISKLGLNRIGRPNGKNGAKPVLSVEEFHVVVIKFILDFNARTLDRIPSPDEARRGVILTPTGFWNSEHDRLRGGGKAFDSSELRVTLSRRAEARINRRGINFESLLFVCSLPEAAGLMQELGDRSKKVTVYYDDESTSVVYVQIRDLIRAGLKTAASPYEFVQCKLHANDCKWASYTFPAVRQAMIEHNEVMQASLMEKDASSARLLSAIKSSISANLGVPKSARETVSSVDPTPRQDASNDNAAIEHAEAAGAQLIRSNILKALRAARR